MRGLAPREIAGFVVSIVAIAAVVWWASRQEAPRFPTSADDLALLGVALLVYGAATVARGWRWHKVLLRAGIDHPSLDAYALICVGYMGNTVLPARGGEALRILLLAERSSARRREVLGSIVAERMFDVVALVLMFATLTFVGIAGAPAGDSPAVIALGVLIAGAVALYAYLRLRRAGRFERFAEILRPVARSSKILVSRVGPALVLVTVAVWLAEGLIFTLVGQSLGLSLSLLDGALLVVLASFFALIPAAPGYVGTYDAALLFGLAALDIRGGHALSFAILVRFVLFGPITLAGLVLLLTRYGGVGRVLRGLRERRAEPAESAA
jgi:glycosyltransferase 2 family protein